MSSSSSSSAAAAAAAAARVYVDDDDYLRHEEDPADMSAEERDMLREIRQVFPKFSAFNNVIWIGELRRSVTVSRASTYDIALHRMRPRNLNQAERMDYQRQTLSHVRELTSRYPGIAFRLADGVPYGHQPDTKPQEYILDTVPISFDTPAPEELAWVSAGEWREFAAAVLDARPRRSRLSDGRTVGQWLHAIKTVHTYFDQGFAEVEYLIDEADAAHGTPGMERDVGGGRMEGTSYRPFRVRDSAEMSVRALNDMSSDAHNTLRNNRTREAIVMLRAPLADLRDGYRTLVRELNKDPEERSTERMQRALNLLGKALPFLGTFIRSNPMLETTAPYIADIRAWLGRLDGHAKLRALQSVRHQVGSADETGSDAASSLTCPDAHMHERRLMGWNLAGLRIGDTARSLRQGERVWRAVLVDNSTPTDMAAQPWEYSLYRQGLQHIPALRRFQEHGMMREPFAPGSILVSKRAEASRAQCLYRIFEIIADHTHGYTVLAKPVALVDLLPGSGADLATNPLERGDRITSGVSARLHARLQDVARDTGRASATFRDLDAAERTRWLEEDQAYREAQIQRNLGEQGLSSSYIPAAERTRRESMDDDTFEAVKARNARRVSEELKTRMAFARKNSDDAFIASLSPSRLHKRIHAGDRMSAQERSFYGDSREGGYLDVLESKLAGDADLREALSVRAHIHGVRAHIHDSARSRYQVSIGGSAAAAGGFDEYESMAEALDDYDAPRRSDRAATLDPSRAGGHSEEETRSRIRIIERLLDRADNPRLQEELAALKAKLGRRE